MKVSTLILSTGIFILSCKSKQNEPQEKFDNIRWATTNGDEYPHRGKMLNDLIINFKLHGIKKAELINLLGRPDKTDNGYLFYTIDREHLGFMTLHTKTLVIKLDKDSAVEWRKIHE